MASNELEMQTRLHEQAESLPATSLSQSGLESILKQGRRRRLTRASAVALACVAPVVAVGVTIVPQLFPERPGVQQPAAPSATEAEVDLKQVRAAASACMESPRSGGDFDGRAGAGGIDEDPLVAAERLIHGYQDIPGAFPPIPGTRDDDVPVMIEESARAAVVAVVRASGEVNAVLDLERSSSDDLWFVSGLLNC